MCNLLSYLWRSRVFLELTDMLFPDRGNGFEKKLFQKLNERKRTGLESYHWSVDDM